MNDNMLTIEERATNFAQMHIPMPQDIGTSKWQQGRYEGYIKGATEQQYVYNELTEKAKAIRSKCIDRFNKYYDDKLNQNEQMKMLGAVLAFDELLEEDSKNELHCAFATMD